MVADETDPAAYVRGLLRSLKLARGSRLTSAAAEKLPADTVRVAHVPAGVHLALTGTARRIDLRVRVGAATWRPAPNSPEAFVVHGPGWSYRVPLDRGADLVRIDLADRPAGQPVRVYLPETVELQLLGLTAVGGEVVPAPRGPAWVVYGDSITQGWSVTEPGRAWPSLVADALGLDLVNLGFAGAARGELPAADVVAGSQAAAVALAWGTNCYSTVPSDATHIAETMRLFLAAVRQGLPDVPVVVVSPIVRPDAELTPNRFGATHAQLRAAIESAVLDFAAARGDGRLALVPGRELVPAADLADDRVHPLDAGHARLAAAVQPHVAAGLHRAGTT
jgi:lysophospholipase L1-like esterase